MFDNVIKTQSAALCDALVSVDALATIASDIRVLIDQISALPRSNEFELTISLVNGQVVMGQAHEFTGRDRTVWTHAHAFVHLDKHHLEERELEEIIAVFDDEPGEVDGEGPYPLFIYGLDRLTYAVLAQLTGCSSMTLARVRAAELGQDPKAELSDDVWWLATEAMQFWEGHFSIDALQARYAGFAG